MSLALYAHALRSARPRQLVARATRPARRRLFPRPDATAVLRPLEANHELWSSPAFAPRVSAPTGVLAEFVRGYGEDALTAARAGDVDLAHRALEAWIGSSPPRVGSAWHPYVVSTRVANWVAATTLAPELATSTVAASVQRQLAHLRRNVEDDILGNHVLRNAKALVLAGEALGDRGAADHGRRLLERELPEQVLADGGHYERSPAYHRLVLCDLLEVARFAPVHEAIERMTSFASASARPDGAPALFNDGGIDLAPELALPSAAKGLDVRSETGYAFVRTPRVWLAFDCGAPAPEFLPAHAHADALSFQLWLDGRPTVIDPGTSTYETGATRAWERGTEAHSTVAVDGDQFRVWGSFRSGPLPRVRLLDATEELLTAEAVLATGVVHRRTLRLRADGLDIEDEITGRGVVDLVSSVPLAAVAAITVAPRSGDAEQEPRAYAERFGERRDATAFVQRVRKSLPWDGGWRLRFTAATLGGV